MSEEKAKGKIYSGVAVMGKVIAQGAISKIIDRRLIWEPSLDGYKKAKREMSAEVKGVFLETFMKKGF